MSGPPAARVRRIFTIVLTCALIAAVVFAVLNRQLIQDKISAASFTPTPAVTDLKASLQLTDEGERIFLASRPTLDGTQHFNTQCSEVKQGAAGHVLGCFIDNRIHLYNVADPRLSDIVKVTAAHELLHAAYTRMRSGDRTVLAEKLLELYDQRSQKDPDLARRMEMYADLPRPAFATELHSVLGSEQADLPKWLEEHYAQWFTNRADITESYRGYQSVFRKLQQDANELRSQMKTLRADVEARKLEYDAAVAAYDADAADFNRRTKKREFAANPKAGEAISKALKERRTALNQDLKSLQDDIARYNEMRSDLEQLGTLSTELEAHLDSALAPVTTRPNEE